jgi:hypothetical protein
MSNTSASMARRVQLCKGRTRTFCAAEGSFCRKIRHRFSLLSESPSTETNPLPAIQITSTSNGAECSSIVALGENRRFAMPMPARFNITRQVTSTVPGRGTDSQFGLGIVSIFIRACSQISAEQMESSLRRSRSHVLEHRARPGHLDTDPLHGSLE